MGDAPAHRAPVSERHVPHVGHRLGDQGPLAGDGRRTLDGTLPGESSNLQVSVPLAYVGKLLKSVYVYQYLRRGQPHVQQRPEALAARQDLSRLAVLAEEARRFF